MASGNRFRGRQKFILKLEQLRREVIEEIVKAQEANARDMVRLAKSRVPVKHGYLKDTIKMEKSVVNSRYSRTRVVAGDNPGGRVYYARLVEFLVVSFFYSSYRTLRRRFNRRYSTAFRKARKRIFK